MFPITQPPIRDPSTHQTMEGISRHHIRVIHDNTRSSSKISNIIIQKHPTTITLWCNMTMHYDALLLSSKSHLTQT
jgi:hypothetical protein